MLAEVKALVYSFIGYDSLNWKQINERLKRLSKSAEKQWKVKNVSAHKSMVLENL